MKCRLSAIAILPGHAKTVPVLADFLFSYGRHLMQYWFCSLAPGAKLTLLNDRMMTRSNGGI